MTCIAGIYILFPSTFSFIHHGKENENAEIGYVSAIAAVVKRVFEESGVGDVVVNIRILNVPQTVCMKSLKNMPESLETMTESVVLNIFDH